MGVPPPEALLALLEDEGEGREREGRAQPDEPVRPRVDLRPEVLGVARADGAVDAVGGQDEVGARERRDVTHLSLELERHLELAAAPAKAGRQTLAAVPGEPGPGGGPRLALESNLHAV